jgi:hypothetical protein
MSQYEKIPCPNNNFNECTYENVLPGFSVHCPFYVVERGACTFIEFYGGKIEATTQPLKTYVEPPVPIGKRGGPDVSGIQWKVGKGRDTYDARPDDKRAWAFTFKYDADAKRATTIVRDEAVELVEYLDSHEGVYEDGKYKYSIGVNRSFLNRALL